MTAASSDLHPFAVVMGQPNAADASGDAALLNLEVMTVMARDSAHALRTAANVCVQRGQPNAVIVGAFSREDIDRVGALMDSCAAQWAATHPITEQNG